MAPEPVRAFVSVGSNIEPAAHIRDALDALDRRYGPLAASPVYRSAAVGFEGADFLNLVVAFTTGDPPERIVDALHGIEAAGGRERDGPRFSDRPLDLDLILYGEAVIARPGLEIPRRDVDAYAFVLWPLADLAPGTRHPRSGETFAELRRRFPAPPARELERVEIDVLPGSGGAA